MISIVIISKDEPALDVTLADLDSQVTALTSRGETAEVVVVDASSGRLDFIRDRHQGIRWLEFDGPPGVRTTIPHQRNAGVRAARGDIIVFIDAGCRPYPDWLERLVAPLSDGDDAVAGVAEATSGANLYQFASRESSLYEISDKTAGKEDAIYLRECATMNFAFRREVFDTVGGFDESFAYGSDVDFSWRLNDLGYRIRLVQGAIVRHDYGSPKRQRRRSYAYGKARARLYRKHSSRRKDILRNDPIAVIYPLFLVGLPLTLVFPAYPLLLLVPAWRNRSHGIFRVIIDHLWYGAGVLAELTGR